MPWLNPERYRRGIKVFHDTDPGRYRISSSVSVLHYESVIDSGIYDTEVNLTLNRVNNQFLNGWRVSANGWHFAYQGFAPVQNQEPQGTVGYGGRQGQNWLNMRPARMGFLRWNTRTFQAVGGAPTFNTPTLVNEQKTIGTDDGDPNLFTFNAGFTATLGNIWQAGAGSVEWIIRAQGGQLKQDFVINQAARDAITAAFNNGPAVQNWFGIAYRMSYLDIARLDYDDPITGHRDISPNDDFEVTDNLVLRDISGRRLGQFDNGEIYVRGRGGRVPIRKRFYFDGTDWWMFIGANVQEMNQNLLPGDLVIDPPISEESIAANADDASQAGTTMNLSGSSNNVYIGGYGANYNAGWIFQSVPIGNGDTINSATLEPRVSVNADNNLVGILAGIDEDTAAAFTTGASNLTGRTDTTATASIGPGATDYPAAGNRPSWDVAAMVAEITTRGGWSNNNRLGFTLVSDNADTLYIGFNDYNGGATNAANFNADVTAAGGGANPKGPLGMPLHGALAGPI